MELRNGFIVGIASYCDRWCEVCAFTSYCRLFAMRTRIEALLDPGLRAMAEAPPHPCEPDVDEPPATHALRQELDVPGVLDMGTPVMAGPLTPAATIVPEHEALRARAERYRTRVRQWLDGRRQGGRVGPRSPTDPVSVIEWFHTLIDARVNGALAVLDHLTFPGDTCVDADGAAKVVLLGIDRSRAAWSTLVSSRAASPTEVAPFVRDLVWLAAAIDRLFPNARRFVRPAFDEPVEAARVLASHGGPS